MQEKITQSSNLLDEHGWLKQKGYATKLILKYDRKHIKASKLRIKEWDYYLVYNDKFGLAFTVADNSYMGLYSATFLDFEQKTEVTKSNMKFMTRGKTKMPSTSEIGDVKVQSKKYSYIFENDGVIRKLKIEIPNFSESKPLKANIILSDEPEDSMVIATPFWEKKTAFYYNQKIIGLKAVGEVEVCGKSLNLPEDTLGILDWGRGVWTYKNTWFWGAGVRQIGAHQFGFNIGYGFGDTTSASENMLFFNGKAHKIDEVRFNIPKNEKGEDNFLEPWTFTSSDGRFEMSFQPILDRHSYSSALIISSNQHQVFGRFTGSAILDDGKKIEIKNFLGFAEKVVNRW